MSQAGSLNSGGGGGGSSVNTLTGNTGGAVPATGNNINTVGTGSITIAGNPGTSTLTTQLTGLTDHNVLIGAGTATITNVSPSTSGFVLTSNGVAADPSFQSISSTGAITTITGDSGGAESPTAGNFNILGSGSITTIGSASTETIELTGLTNHNVLVGAGTTTITKVAPSATSGIPLISQGAAADPAFGMAVVAGGGTGDSSFTAYSVICGGTTSTGALQNVSGVGSAGEVLTSNGAGALPTWQPGGVGTYYSITPYIVGSDSHSQYSTIQAAINQAVTDGASDSTPKNIYVKPGTYTETLTGNAGIRIIGLSVPALGQFLALPTDLSVQWNGVCTWSSGTMEFQNIETTYNGSGNIFTIPGSGTLILQSCILNNVGGAGVIIADGGSNATLYVDNCLTNQIGTYLNSTNTGMTGWFSNCLGAVADGGIMVTVGGTWNFINCSIDPNWTMGNTEAYTITINEGHYNTGFIDTSANSQAGNVIILNSVNLNSASTVIKSGTANITLNNCYGNVTTIIDDSSGPGGSTILFNGGDFTSTTNLALLGAGSTYSAYNVIVNTGDVISNTDNVATTATSGFFYIPAVNGVPTGTANTYGNAIPIVYDTASNHLYAYNGGTWRSVLLI